MKKKILLNSAATLTFASVNLVASCNYEEKSKEPDFPKTPEEQKYDELFNKYKEKYVGTDNYVFDDFEEFDFNNRDYYEIINVNKLIELRPTYESIKLENFNNENIFIYFKQEKTEIFFKWLLDFQFKFKVYKDVIDKLAPNKKIKYKNGNEIYLVKESNYKFKFNFSQSDKDYNEIFSINTTIMEYLLSIPNLHLEGRFAFNKALYFPEDYNNNYFSKINLLSNFGIFQYKANENYKWFSTPKPKIEKIFPGILQKEIDKFHSSSPIINVFTTENLGFTSRNYLNDWYNIENDLSARENAQIIANQDSENFYDYDLTFSRERKVQDYDVKADEKKEYIKKDSIHFILSRPLKIISTEGKNEKRRN
ncbi:hypothetical protein ACR34G_03360 [Mycoplasma sp. 480]|uniref:hypothetical protein n=1 Tax=Mycoplasma sp. 480 TaxID=3440155 RepID=UPI003F513F87